MTSQVKFISKNHTIPFASATQASNKPLDIPLASQQLIEHEVLIKEDVVMACSADDEETLAILNWMRNYNDENQPLHSSNHKNEESKDSNNENNANHENKMEIEKGQAAATIEEEIDAMFHKKKNSASLLFEDSENADFYDDDEGLEEEQMNEEELVRATQGELMDLRYRVEIIIII